MRGIHHHNRHLKKQMIGGGSNRVMKGVNVQAGAKFSNVSELQHLTATQKLRSKFFTSPFNVLHKSEEQCWRNFCAALIQATYKMALTRRLFKYHRFAMYHIAAIQIQWAWRGYFQRKRKVPQKSREVVAVEKIQRAWRSFTNVRIFKYYKELINFKEKGDPTQLLKSVNPGEAFILDAATKCHVRFRLGGDVSYYSFVITNLLAEIPSIDLLQDFCTWRRGRHQCVCPQRLRKNKERKEKGDNQHPL